jgi:hypothetical protein
MVDAVSFIVTGRDALNQIKSTTDH